ncbi:MAG TPA: hypothetical protein DCP69_04030 [Candidatus Omnitrophica bacterium]|nr:hypothetical protein [Candidatus Omnitrophota bacterium]
MKTTEWVALLGALGGMIVAVLTSLYGLGEHAPGVVGGLLLAAAMLGVNIILERRIETLSAEIVRLNNEYAETLKESGLAMQSMASALSRLAENQSLQSMLTKWREEAAANALKDSTAAIAAALAEHTKAVAQDVADKALAQERERSGNANGK